MTGTTIHNDATGYSQPVANTAQDPMRFTIEDELSIRTRQQLKMRVVDAIAAGNKHVVLDASTCGYIDSSGIGVLVSLNKKCKEADGSLVIEGLNGDLRVWLAIVNMDAVLTIVPPITAAERAGT